MAEGMKDSSVKWVGEIPTEWSVAPLRFLATPNPGTRDYNPTDNYLALENIEPWMGRLTTDETPDEVDSSVACFSKGDVLFGKLRPYLAKVYEAETDGVCSTELIPIHPIDIDGSYLFWLLINKSFIDTINAQTQGVKMPRTSWVQLGKIYCPLPTATEQSAIASKLDRETAKLDMTISTLEEQIDVLERYRRSLICEAVTKGLNRSAPMRPSGIDWIGDIPEGWAVKKLKHLTKSFESGTSVRAAAYPAEPNEKGVLSLSAVFGGVFNPSANKTVDGDELSRVSCPVKGGSLLVSRCNTSEWVGLPAYVDKDYPNLYLPDKLWQIDCGSTELNRFIWYALQSKSAREYCAVMSVGSSDSMQNIASSDLLNMYIALPATQEERNAIVAYLDEKCARIDSLLAAKREQIDILKKRRQSLIYEYVTGKRRVSKEA